MVNSYPVIFAEIRKRIPISVCQTFIKVVYANLSSGIAFSSARICSEVSMSASEKTLRNEVGAVSTMSCISTMVHSVIAIRRKCVWVFPSAIVIWLCCKEGNLNKMRFKDNKKWHIKII